MAHHFNGFRQAASLLVMLPIFLSFLMSACSQQQAQGGFQMPPMPVVTASVVQSAVIDPFEAIGTIEAEDAFTVVSVIDAIVISRPFREGEGIAKGGVIAQLDDTQLRAEEARALALLEQSKVTFDRIKTITDEGLGAAQTLDDAAAALKVAEADLAVIRARLKKTRVVAPFAGIAGARHVSPGAFVRAGSAITELAQIQQLRVTFSAPERYFSQLQRGAEVKVSTTAYSGYELTGKVEIIDPIVDLATRRVKVIARLDNGGGKFGPGL